MFLSGCGGGPWRGHNPGPGAADPWPLAPTTVMAPDGDKTHHAGPTYSPATPYKWGPRARTKLTPDYQSPMIFDPMK